MIVPIPRSQRTSEENVLPLINIVFLLLIFFMIAGVISATTPFPVDPPTTRAAEASDPPRDGIAIGRDGQLAFGGEEITLAELDEYLGNWQRDAAPDDVLVVQADADASTRELLDVIERLRAADVATIRLITVGGAEEP